MITADLRENCFTKNKRTILTTLTLIWTTSKK